MIIFWILAAGLMVLALLFVVAPLLSRHESAPGVGQDQLNLEIYHRQIQELDADLAAGDLSQVQYRAARRDLERELLYDVNGDSAARPEQTGKSGAMTALVLAVAVPIAAVVLYLQIGNSGIIPRLEATAGQSAVAEDHPTTPGSGAPSLDVLVERLAEKLEQNPENLDGWLMLGRSYFATSQPQKALAALERAYSLAPQNPEVILVYAEATASYAGGKLAGRPAELIRTALEIDPENATARWLNGLIAYQEDDFATAIERWEGILADLDPAGEDAAELAEFIADARKRESMPPPESSASGAEVTVADVPSSTVNETPPTDSTAGPTIKVQVSLAEALWPVADQNDALFVYAKAASGPPMPLAVKRLKVADLPASVTLDDSMAMMPALRLSAFPEVTVGARISKSGQATAQRGDLEGEIGAVKPEDADPVDVLIDRVRP